MPRIKKELVLTGSLQTLHTVSAGQNLKRAAIDILNLTSAQHEIEMHMVPPGGSPSSATRIFDRKIGANPLRGGALDKWLLFQNLKEDATLEAKADAASVVRVGLGLIEVADNDDLVQASGALLTTTEQTLLTVDANRQLTSLQVIACNVGSVPSDAADFKLWFVASGGSTSDLTTEIYARVGLSAPDPGETQYYFIERHLGPGGTVRTWASQSSKIAMRLGGLQETI